jgi:glutamate formiminotransferase/formiminotetrahydrofolate cyclodeaminase
MANRLVECIPNFSEARRPEVVEEIINTIQSIPGVHILDRHSDLDHNRTVVTYIGEPEPVEEAAFLAIAKAAELIDLENHHGEHPRIGATDVVPFVPITDVTMVECIEMARRLGKRVGSELGIPVYLYEEAATIPERQNLENIRFGQYELLKTEISSNPARYPDFGPPKLSGAGATVIGARQPLIAFNVYLTTDDVSIAQRIAKTVRNSSGGFRFVKAMGVLVNGKAQVSMNFTNFHLSALATVVETIRNEAKRYGVGILSSELVGLTPQEALVDAAVWYLQLDQFDREQILERKLYEVMTASMAPSATVPQEWSFIEQVASGTPTPGGGSASAHTGALAAALVAMVGRLTIGKKKYAAVEQEMWKLVEQAETLKNELTHAVDEDAKAFEGILTANRMPKNNQEELDIRAVAQKKAALHAAQIPLRTAGLCLEVLKLAHMAIEQGNINAISDGGSAAMLSLAALSGAGMNVKINIASYQDDAEAKAILSQLEAIEKEAHQLEKDIRAGLSQRGGISPY